jgi:signal transduction histidine kinase
MVHSIRQRLILSYVMLTLLTVGAVGVVALLLVEHHTRLEERDYLVTNAEALARQAQSAVQGAPAGSGLRALVHPASFLFNARIRILDAHGEVLSDSGPRSEADQLVWLTSEEAGAPGEAGAVALPPSPGDPAVVGGRLAIAPPAGTQDTLLLRVRRSPQSGTEVRILGHPKAVAEVALPRAITLTTGAQGGAGVAAGGHAADAVPWEATMTVADRVARVPIGQPDQPVGYVELSRGPDSQAETVLATRRALLMAGLLATAIAVMLGWVVSRSLTAPLRQLTAAAGRMSAGDLTARTPPLGADEIGQLAVQWNQMADRLQASFVELAAERDALRRFIADASHELRTPITALHNFNELLQRQAGDDPATRAEFLRESQAQIERLEWITGHLLDLSRLDAGLLALDRQPQDLGELLTAVSGAFRARAQERAVDLVVTAPAPPYELICDRARMEMALSNLVDNALRYSPAGGTVEIGVVAGPDTVELWVRDTGPGVAAQDQDHLFERFYRGRDAAADGLGLGLAIVQSVVQAHGGQATVASAAGGGARFALTFPVSA